MNPASTEFYRQCLKAKQSAPALVELSDTKRSALLNDIAAALNRAKAQILDANAKDCEQAQKMVAAHTMSGALYNRLKLTPEKAEGLSVYASTIAKLPCSLKTADYQMELAEGLVIERKRYPLGLIATIYESRPEVTVQVACLAIKSGNAFILKGGKEALESNRCLFEIIKQVLTSYDIADVAILVENREQIQEILNMERVVDLIIPRGSNEFVRYIKQNSIIPVLGHADGICHIYLDADADPAKAERIVLDAKTDYPAACNAVETLLYDSASKKMLVTVLRKLSEAGVTLHVCQKTAELLSGTNIPFQPKHDGWAVEYCGTELSVRLVNSLQDAISHINQYGSGHTDSIITENKEHAETFMAQVDSASVFHNASTRFADGFVYGLGAEVGISTEKIHARGPVGIEGLLTTKFFLHSKNETGDIRSEYTQRIKQFTHRTL